VETITADESPLCIAGQISARLEEAASMFRVWNDLQSRTSAWSDNGFVERRVRGIIYKVWTRTLLFAEKEYQMLSEISQITQMKREKSSEICVICG